MATTKTLTPTNQTITMAAFQGEAPDQRQIADAEGKLADAVNAVHSSITANNLGSFSTLSDLQTALLAAAQNVAQYGVQCVSFYAGASYSGFANGSRYQGMVNIVSKSSSAIYFSIIFESSKNDAPVMGNYANGTWSWCQLAPQEELANISGSTVSGLLANAYDAITTTNRVVLVKFWNAGQWTGWAFKSTDGNSGMMFVARTDTQPYMVNVASGTKSYRQVTTSSL